MFIIVNTYVSPPEVIDKYLAEHREYLAACYKNNYFIVAGPQVPRTGGILISQLSECEQLENILGRDPLIANKLMEYRLIEFTPTKYHADFAPFIN